MHLRVQELFLSAAYFFGSLLFFPLISLAEEEIQPYIQSVEGAEKGMTLWQVLQSGGIVMIVLMILSVAMTTLVVYMFLRLQITKLVPESFTREMIRHLEGGYFGEVEHACKNNPNIIGAILLGGLRKKESGFPVVKETIEITAKKEVGALWALINYLADFAAVAPMVGLLGTVVGMIQAFNAIAFQTAVVKPILLAGGVSKAMVTTAGGLVIAIVAMIFYSVFRFKIQNITNAVEVLTHEIMAVFSKLDSKPAGSKS